MTNPFAWMAVGAALQLAVLALCWKYVEKHPPAAAPAIVQFIVILLLVLW